MFDIGFSEILVIFILALIVLGPEKLPRVVREVGRWVGRARAMARQFQEQLEEEVDSIATGRSARSLCGRWAAVPPASPPPRDAGPHGAGIEHRRPWQTAAEPLPEAAASSGEHATRVPHPWHS